MTASESYHDHIVLCGLDGFGLRTLEALLLLDAPVVVIARAPSEEFVEKVRGWGVLLIEGSHRDEAVLRRAGVERAEALLITENDDVGNLHAALAAQELNPRLRIVLRLFNRELGRKMQTLIGGCTISAVRRWRPRTLWRPRCTTTGSSASRSRDIP